MIMKPKVTFAQEKAAQRKRKSDSNDEGSPKKKKFNKNIERKMPKDNSVPTSAEKSSGDKKIKSILKNKDSVSNGQKKVLKNGIHSKKKFHSKKDNQSKKDNHLKKEAELLHMKKKQRKLERRKQKNAQNFERSQKLKQLWEQMRSDKCNDEEKKRLVTECMKLIKGHAKELSYAHDSVRVIEWAFHLGTAEQKHTLFEELKDHLLVLAKSKYGKFFLIKVLHHGSKNQKNYLIKQFHGNVIELIRHTESASVVEMAFNECANATQRAELIQEFYGPSYRYFKESNCHCLKQLLLKVPEQKTLILSNMKSTLLKIMQKTVIKHSIVHFVLREFLDNADAESKKEIIEAVREIMVEMLHTKDGARAAMDCLWFGTSKDRKVMIKSFKTHVVKIAKEEHGHMVLLALFDCVDDTKLVQRHIISELAAGVSDVVENLHGRKVLIYLIAPRDPLTFHPDVVKILDAGQKSETSKKDAEVRRSELRTSISAALIQYIATSIQKLYTNNSCCIFILDILKYADGDASEAYKAIAKLASIEYSSNLKNSHIMESSGSAFLMKKLITNDQRNPKEGCFSQVFVTEVDTKAMKSWVLCNRGCFALLGLLETEIPDVVKNVKSSLFGLHSLLAKKTYKGAELLLTKLKQLPKDVPSV